jgi:K+-transporting ATPase KdpF subunit
VVRAPGGSSAGPRRQERVNARHEAVNAPGAPASRTFTGGVIDTIIAAALGLALLAYLVYALIRPEKF